MSTIKFIKRIQQIIAGSFADFSSAQFYSTHLSNIPALNNMQFFELKSIW